MEPRNRWRCRIQASRHATAVAVVLLLPGALSAAAPTRQEGALSIEGRDGKLTTRALEGLDVPGLEALGAVAIRVDGLRAAEAPVMTITDRAEVALSGGDRVLAAIAGGDGDELRLTLLGGIRVGVDVERLSQVVFPARLPGGAGAVAAAESGDRLYWLRGGGLDRVDGTLESFTSDGVAFDSVLGRRT